MCFSCCFASRTFIEKYEPPVRDEVPKPSPSIRSDPWYPAFLVQDFSSRPRVIYKISDDCCEHPLYKYETSEEKMLSDQHRLLRIVQCHNARFSSAQGGSPFAGEQKGLFNELILPAGAYVYAAGDFHGHLESLFALLQCMQQAGYLDAQYRTISNFHIVFLGDYLDRGANAIQLLSLILSLRFLNPKNVHLIRGNHDTVFLPTREAVASRETIAFLERYQALFSDCFSTFDLALCVSTVERHEKKRGYLQREYVHFSHGLFSLAVDPASFLRGRTHQEYLERPAGYSERLLSSEKVNEAAAMKLFQQFSENRGACSLDSYMWSDIGKSSKGSVRGVGHVFSVQDIQLYTKATETKDFKICFFVRGHEHFFAEYSLPTSKYPSKVLAMTLPLNFFTPQVQSEVQGVLFQVAPRVRNWKKVVVVTERETSASLLACRILSSPHGIYEPSVFRGMRLPLTLPDSCLLS